MGLPLLTQASTHACTSPHPPRGRDCGAVFLALALCCPLYPTLSAFSSPAS